MYCIYNIENDYIKSIKSSQLFNTDNMKVQIHTMAYLYNSDCVKPDCEFIYKALVDLNFTKIHNYISFFKFNQIIHKKKRLFQEIKKHKITKRYEIINKINN